MNRPLTEDERVTLINAVQGIVGRMDRTMPADAREEAYKFAVRLLMREYRLRYQPEQDGAPPLTYEVQVRPAPPQYSPPPQYPPTYRIPAAESFNPFA